MLRQRRARPARAPRPARCCASTQPLRFGGNAVWAEWFRGRLDEIRVYDRALTAAQIQADMARAVSILNHSCTRLRKARANARASQAQRGK